MKTSQRKITLWAHKAIQQSSFFNIVLIIGIIIFGVSALSFLLAKTQYLVVKMRITERELVYSKNSPASWYALQLSKGVTEKDVLGRTVAEVIDIYTYDSPVVDPAETSASKKVTYVTLRLRVRVNQRTNKVQYQGNIIAIGEQLRLAIGKNLFTGLITEIDGSSVSRTPTYITIKTQYLLFRQGRTDTSGVEPFVADAVSVGDRIYDSSGNTMVEVLLKESPPAKRLVQDAGGNIREQADPWLKDLFLTLRVRVNKIGKDYYFYDDVVVRINENLRLVFPHIIIKPTVIDILSA